MADEDADLTRPPPHLEGILLKQDPHKYMRGWKSRYFVVRKDNVFYYKNKEEAHTNTRFTGVIKLPEVEEITSTTFSKIPKPSYVNCGFTLSQADGGRRVYSLLAETPEDCERWVRGLKYIKTYWSAQNVHRTTVLNDEEITRRMRLDDDDMDDYIDPIFTVDGEGSDSPRQRRQSQGRTRVQSMPRGAISLSRVIVHLTGGETKRVAFEQDSTVKKVLLLLSPAVNAEDCFVWQVTKDGVVNRLNASDAIAPLRSTTDKFFCLDKQYRPVVVFFGDGNSVATDVPYDTKAHELVDLKCMKDKQIILGVSSAGLFLRDTAGKDVLFASDDIPCDLLYGESSDGLPYFKSDIGQLVMHNKRQFDSAPSTRSSSRGIREAAEEKKKREKAASQESKRQQLLNRIDTQRQVQMKRNEQRKAAENTAALDDDSDDSGDFFSPDEDILKRSLSRKKRKPRLNKDPEDTPFEMVTDFFSDAIPPGGKLEVTESALLSPPSDDKEREFAGSTSSSGSLGMGTADSAESFSESVQHTSSDKSMLEAGAETGEGSADTSSKNGNLQQSETPQQEETAESGSTSTVPSQSPDSAAIVSQAAQSAVSNRPGRSKETVRLNRVRFSNEVSVSRDASDSEVKATDTVVLTSRDNGNASDSGDDDMARETTSTPSSDYTTEEPEDDSGSDMDDEWHRPQDDELNDLVTNPLDEIEKSKIRTKASRGSSLNMSRRGKQNPNRQSFGDFEQKHTHALQELENRQSKVVSEDIWQLVSSETFDSKAAAEAARKSVRRHTIVQVAPTPAQAAGAAAGKTMSQTDGISVKIGDPSQTSSSNKMLSRQRSVHVPKKGRSASLNQGQSADTEHDEDKDIVSEDTLVQESRSLGFGNRPMLTLEGVHIHNQEMERVTALLDREHQLTKDQEDKEKRSESPAGGRHIGSLQAKLQALEKGSSEKAPTRVHRPLPVDISRLLPETSTTMSSGAVSTQGGRPFPITNPARLKSVLMQSKQRDGGSSQTTYSKVMDFISLSGTLLRNSGGHWHLETGSSWHQDVDEDTEDHIEVFKMPGGIKAAYNHTQRRWHVTPSTKSVAAAVSESPNQVDAMPRSFAPPDGVFLPLKSKSTAGQIPGAMNMSGTPMTAIPVAVPVATPTSAAETSVETRLHTAAPNDISHGSVFAAKEQLVKGVLGSTEYLLAHFSATREPDKKCILGDDSRTPGIGTYVRGPFCTSIAAVMGNGLKPTRLGGLIVHSLWDVAVAATFSGSGLVSQAAQRAVEGIRNHPLMQDSNMKYRTFVCVALTENFLEPWLDHLRQQHDVLRKYYYPDAFLIQATAECSHLYDNLLLTIQPLAELPFKLHVTFEPQQIFIAGERKRLDKQRRQQQDLEEQRRQQPEQPAGDLQADTSVEVSQPVSPVPLTGFVNGGVIGKRGATPLIGKASTASVQNGPAVSQASDTPPAENSVQSQLSNISNKMFSRFKQAVANVQGDDDATDSGSHEEYGAAVVEGLKQRWTTVSQKSKQAIADLKMKLTEADQEEAVQLEEEESQNRFVEALFTNMTEDEDELQFNKGDVLQVVQEVNDEWLLCQLGGSEGLVAKNYVKAL